MFPPNFIINVNCFCGDGYSQILQTPLNSSEVETILNWSSLFLLWVLVFFTQINKQTFF